MPSSATSPKLTNAAELLARGAVPSAQWRPGLGEAACHAEVFAPAREASGAGLALALARDGWRDLNGGELADVSDERGILWVQDAKAAKLGGLHAPHRPRATRAEVTPEPVRIVTGKSMEPERLRV